MEAGRRRDTTAWEQMLPWKQMLPKEELFSSALALSQPPVGGGRLCSSGMGRGKWANRGSQEGGSLPRPNQVLVNSEPPLGIFGTPWSILTQRVGPRNQELQTQFQSPVKTLPQGLKAMVSEHPKNAEHALERPARACATVKALG